MSVAGRAFISKYSSGKQYRRGSRPVVPHYEARTSPRVPLDRFIVCLRAGDLVVAGNLSSGGVGFEAPGPVKIGEPVCVSLILPETGEPASISAVVRHVEKIAAGRFYVGVRFLEVDHFVQSPIDRYVEEAALLAVLA